MFVKVGDSVVNAEKVLYLHQVNRDEVLLVFGFTHEGRPVGRKIKVPLAEVKEILNQAVVHA